MTVCAAVAMTARNLRGIPCVSCNGCNTYWGVDIFGHEPNVLLTSDKNYRRWVESVPFPQLRTGLGVQPTWSYSALGNCNGSLVVSMSKAQMRGSALANRSGLCSNTTCPPCTSPCIRIPMYTKCTWCRTADGSSCANASSAWLHLRWQLPLACASAQPRHLVSANCFQVEKAYTGSEE